MKIRGENVEKEVEDLSSVKRLGKWQKGVTTVEYAIMLALVALAVAAATPSVKSAVVSTFGQVSSALGKTY